MTDKKNIVKKIKNVYDTIPSTQGCLENLETCGGWCCKIQNPHVLSVEFSRTWNYVVNHFGMQYIIDLLELSLRLYISDIPTKGCIFFDKDEKMCKIHEYRPLACRLYGIMPDDEFQERYNVLKEKFKDDPLADVRPQCNLVETTNGKKLTKDDTDSYWNQMVDIEIEYGFKKEDVHDGAGGSYKTFHDHILMRYLPDDIFQKFQGIRIFSHNKNNIMSKEEVEKAISEYIAALRKNV